MKFFRKNFSNLSKKDKSPDYFGNISVNWQNLYSLKGIPKTINGDFRCYNNKLNTLEYVPIKINGDLYCFDNPLKTIKHLKDTKGINILYISESEHMTKNDYIREIFEYSIKVETIIIVRDRLYIIFNNDHKDLKKV